MPKPSARAKREIDSSECSIIDGAVKEIAEVFCSWRGQIVVAYSGGKDSSAVLKLVACALILNPDLSKRVTIIYCDTKVENPILDEFVKKTLKALKTELVALGLDTKVKILSPALHQRYFVRVIGRGYPPPTTFFRWCTTDLRIRPVQAFIRKAGRGALVVIGTRRGESVQRDRLLAKANDGLGGPVIQKQMENGRETSLYMPIANYSVEDVWETLAEISTLQSIDIYELAQLYRQGGGECPTIRDSKDQPCASARFGCWVCTVVRRDRSTENLLKAGFNNLKPYFEFRSWLAEIRNEPNRRCAARRNGSSGLGPFTLATRRSLLRRVRQLEKTVRQTLITEREEQAIRALWKADQGSPEYAAMERKRQRNGKASKRLLAPRRARVERKSVLYPTSGARRPVVR